MEKTQESWLSVVIPFLSGVNIPTYKCSDHAFLTGMNLQEKIDSGYV